MQQRIQSKIEGNSGGEQFSKIAMNSSYGSDGMNQEHFSDIKLCDIHETFRKHLNGRFKSDRKLDSMMLAVAGDPKQNYTQGFSAVIKDKQFYDKNFYKFFPKPKSVIEQENKCCKNKIKEIQIQDEKKPLGVAYEHCGSTLIALAPKNYWLRQEFDKKDPIVVKLK
ncbi:MAG: hypothetical protein EZS28_045672, partial [Streblomastix strix]